MPHPLKRMQVVQELTNSEKWMGGLSDTSSTTNAKPSSKKEQHFTFCKNDRTLRYSLFSGGSKNRFYMNNDTFCVTNFIAIDLGTVKCIICGFTDSKDSICWQQEILKCNDSHTSFVGPKKNLVLCRTSLLYQAFLLFFPFLFYY